MGQIFFKSNFLCRQKELALRKEILEAFPLFKPDVYKNGNFTTTTPRLVCAYGEAGLTYRYSNNIRTPLPWLPTLKVLKDEIQPFCSHQLNFALINIYRDLKDSIVWHADNEKDIVPSSDIASFSMGATRNFQIKGRFETDKFAKNICLGNNSLLIMGGDMQQLTLHRVPKFQGEEGLRINITFRSIIYWTSPSPSLTAQMGPAHVHTSSITLTHTGHTSSTPTLTHSLTTHKSTSTLAPAHTYSATHTHSLTHVHEYTSTLAPTHTYS